MTKPLCIYHGQCADGFAAAWAVRKALPDAEFHPGVYQDAPPDVTDRDVIMVDFSYKRPVINEMAVVAKSILILDHHKSAAEDLAGLEPVPTPRGPVCGWRPDSGVYATFDMNRSGAGIAWDHFHGPDTRPALINHVEDRDLWRFKIDGTREIQAALFSYPYDFDVWESLMKAGVGALYDEGFAIERKHHKDVAELVGVCKRDMIIGGHRVPAASLPYTLTSDAGHLMCQPFDVLFAACYWDTPGFRVFSLRSIDGGADVSEIAKQYGGGGHEHAAGFRVPLADIGQFEV